MISLLESFDHDPLIFVPEKLVIIPQASEVFLEILKAPAKGKALDLILQKTIELRVIW